MRRDAVIAVVAILLLGCGGGPANAHQSAQGWSYPLECCAGQDCKEVPAEDVQSVAGGFRYRPTGEHVP